MAPEIIAALIAGGVGIAGTLITVFRDEIAGVLFAGTRYNYLKGNWRCVWDVAATPTAPARQLQDQISITRARGALVRGKGVDPDFGEYPIKGEASEFAITLSYCGVQEKRLLRGVVILKKQSPTAMSGVWCQFALDGALKSGTTTWTKI